MSHHRCNCCATLDCQQPGPCCEPPESELGYGRCTPRGYVKQSDGSWSGAAPTSIHGTVSAVGVFYFAKAIRNFGTPGGVVQTWDVAFQFDNADPRAQVILTGGSSNVPCADFSGSMQFTDPYDQDDPDDTLEDLTCAFPLAPVVTITRELRANLQYTPKGNLATSFDWGSGGSNGALGKYVVVVEAWECRVTLEIGVGRPAGRPPGFAAVPFGEALIELGNLGGVPASASIRAPEVVAFALTPCGTKVRVTINKPLNATPLQQEADIDDWCDPLVGIISPGVCRICRAVGIEMTVEVDLADLFTACERCDLIVESPCCNAPGGGMFMPKPRVPVSGGAAWEPTPVRVSTSRVIELPVDGGTLTYTLTGLLNDEIDWSLGCPLGLAVGDNAERTVTTGPGGPYPDSVSDLRVFAQVFPGGGGGGPPGSSLPFIRLELESNLYTLLTVDIPTDPAFTTFTATLDYLGDPRFVVTRDISRWGRFVRVTETVESLPGSGVSQRHSMSMTVGPLFPCVLPSGGGSGGGDSLVLVGAGASDHGSGGCGGCGGGIA